MSSSATFVIITPRIETLSEDKKHIAVDDVALVSGLESIFGHVEKHQVADDCWYECRL